MSDDINAGFATLAIHAGAQPDPLTGAGATPIDQTVGFVFGRYDHAVSPVGLQAMGLIGSQIANPTNAVLEERITALEGGSAALAVASGHAAQLVAFGTLLRPGDDFIASRRLSGGSVNQFAHAFPTFGWQARWADPDRPETFAEAVTDKTRAIFCESFSDPGGTMTDIEALARVAKDARVPLLVDNTLATPYLVRPLEHGADIVVHSATKFLGGHGHAIGGLVVDGGTFDWIGDSRYPILSRPCASYDDMVLAESFGNFAFATACRVLGLRDLGPALSPFDAFLILTGMETLPLRMQRHCDNALAVARHLLGHAAVSWVRYAGLETDDSHALTRRYAPLGSGAVFSFGLAGGYEAGVSLVNKLRLFSRLADVGDTRSLVIHPASTTDRRSESGRHVGAGPDVVRVSIGLEDVRDIIADLDQALG